MKLYEGLFLVDSADAAADWAGTIGAIEKVLSRAEAEVVSLNKWDERKLAYDVNGRGRGTYILSYFKCGPDKITSIERDVQLSEQIIRVMILTTDRMGEDDISKDTPAGVAERAAAAAEIKAAEAAEIAEAEAQAAAEIAEAEAELAASESEATESVVEEETASGDEVAESEESSDADVAAVEETLDEDAAEPEESSDDAK
ncbi:MAG: 30S ribosomal protein S6 [Planctomycetes bacterium]|nr:30S ribosomal protein S6 [Planctomycetota bacterium]